MSEVMSLDGFLGHTTSGGDGSNFLRWKKRTPPTVDVWFHTRSPIISLWRHGFKRIVELKTESGETYNKVGFYSWNCWENEAILKQQYFRDKNSGERNHPPEVCGFCKTIEFIRSAVEEGKLDWKQPIFKFEIGDESDMVFHAGGIYNAYAKKNLTREELEDLNSAKIYRNKAWNENCMPKCFYVFSVADNDNPDKGVFVSIESSGLGDKVKAAINDRKTSKGVDAGNPILNPYAIRWEHHPSDPDMNKRYKAIPMDTIALTPEIHRLIAETAPPDVSDLIKPGNPKLLRSLMEKHWCGPDIIPWDKLFADCEKVFGESGDDPTDFPFGDDDESDSNAATIASTVESNFNVSKEDKKEAERSETQPVEGSASDETCECDNCNAEMPIAETICKNCGAIYKEDGSFEMPEVKKRKRSAVKKESKPETTKAAAPKEQPTESTDEWFDPLGVDDIPF